MGDVEKNLTVWAYIRSRVVFEWQAMMIRIKPLFLNLVDVFSK